MHPHHLALKVGNLQKMGNFYGRFLGLSMQDRKYDEKGRLRSIWLKAGNLILMLEKGKGSLRSGRGWYLFALSIQARKKEFWRKKLRLKKVKIEHESAHSLYFRDPEGNRLALSHYPFKTKFL
ncbi:MAG: VOC family protein [Deltaproteobacteria bacterium]|nr:VOC family protein [Deltaproteobacteria bacterium]